jgi:DNA-binding LytR/AlgR family response regulator
MHDLSPALRERRPVAIHASPIARALVRTLIVALAAGLFLAIAGAFGTDAQPLSRRLGYWLVTMSLASLIAMGVWLPAMRGGHLDRRPWLGVGLLSLVASLPLTVLVWRLSALFFAPRGQANAMLLPFYFPPVLSVTAVMMAVNVLAARRGAAPTLTHAAPQAAEPPRFLERLPPGLRGGELYAVRSEDHYLRLHTSKGSDLILMRLSDAIAELDGLEGARTHRSWWVARAAVAQARRRDGRTVLVLKDGAEVPVARGSVAPLRGAGWF